MYDIHTWNEIKAFLRNWPLLETRARWSKPKAKFCTFRLIVETGKGWAKYLTQRWQCTCSIGLNLWHTYFWEGAAVWAGRLAHIAPKFQFGRFWGAIHQLGFDRKLILTIPPLLQTDIAPCRWILAKFHNPRLSY